MFRFDGENEAQRQTEKRTHQNPVIRRQTERYGMGRNPENDDGLRQK